MKKKRRTRCLYRKMVGRVEVSVWYDAENVDLLGLYWNRAKRDEQERAWGYRWVVGVQVWRWEVEVMKIGS